MLFTLLFSATALAAMPLWISEDSFRKQGQVLTIVCSGKGDTIAKARSEAMNSCMESAGEQLPTTWKLKSKSEETTDDVKLKKEVLADQHIEGLSCDVQKEYVDTRNENPQVFVKCRFDLAKARSQALNMEKITAANSVGVMSYPDCDEIYISGGPFGRHVNCKPGEVTTITLVPGEDRISIHKEHGFRAQSLKLNHDVSYQEFKVHLEHYDAHTDDWMLTGAEAKNMRPMHPDEVVLTPDSVVKH